MAIIVLYVNQQFQVYTELVRLKNIYFSFRNISSKTWGPYSPLPFWEQQYQHLLLGKLSIFSEVLSILRVVIYSLGQWVVMVLQCLSVHTSHAAHHPFLGMPLTLTTLTSGLVISFTKHLSVIFSYVPNPLHFSLLCLSTSSLTNVVLFCTSSFLA